MRRASYRQLPSSSPCSSRRMVVHMSTTILAYCLICSSSTGFTCTDLFERSCMVPEVGIEPTLPEENGILRLAPASGTTSEMSNDPHIHWVICQCATIREMREVARNATRQGQFRGQRVRLGSGPRIVRDASTDAQGCYLQAVAECVP